jgi:tRNA threonylcarbamoyladenosine biosynthesis protein TsaE
MKAKDSEPEHRNLLGLIYPVFAIRECVDEAETLEFASEFMRGLKPGALVALTGDLGAGKTTWVRGMAQALGLESWVHSPTYALRHEYGNPVQLQHIDLYRLGQGADLAELGLEDAASVAQESQSVICIEWPERMPEGTRFHHWFHLAVDEKRPDARTVTWYRLIG